MHVREAKRVTEKRQKMTDDFFRTLHALEDLDTKSHHWHEEIGTYDLRQRKFIQPINQIKIIAPRLHVTVGQLDFMRKVRLPVVCYLHENGLHARQRFILQRKNFKCKLQINDDHWIIKKARERIQKERGLYEDLLAINNVNFESNDYRSSQERDELLKRAASLAKYRLTAAEIAEVLNVPKDYIRTHIAAFRDRG